MKVIVLGASGMVGKGVLIECLRDPAVTQVLSLGRSPSGLSDAKLVDLIHADLYDLSAIEDRLSGYDACFFCLGVTSLGLDEAAYTRITYDLTLAVASTLARLNPSMCFTYVSGTGTDSSEQGKSMWARVKGRTENAVARLPFRSVFLFRPGAIQPLHGADPRVPWIRTIYAVMAPVLGFAVRKFPKYVTTTEQIGRAMLRVVRDGAPKQILEPEDINRL